MFNSRTCLISIYDNLIISVAVNGIDLSLMLATYSSKTVNNIEMKFGRVVENHELINLACFNWYMAQLLHHNDVITVKFCCFYFRNIAEQK